MDGNSNSDMLGCRAGYVDVVRALVEQGWSEIGHCKRSRENGIGTRARENHHKVVQLLQELQESTDSKPLKAESSSMARHPSNAGASAATKIDVAPSYTAQLERKCDDLERELSEQREL